MLAIHSRQPVGDLLDLMGVDRCWPEVFDAMVAEMQRLAGPPQESGSEAAIEAKRRANLEDLERRMRTRSRR